MAEVKEWGPFKLIMGVLYSDPEAWQKAMEICQQKFGPIQDQLGPVPFDWTDYYNKEMGPAIMRVWYAFSGLIHPDLLVDIKLMTNQIEKELAVEGKRRVNLDPGLLSPWNIVLATAKARSQRVYLAKGIFADLTLVFFNKEYRAFRWTFPDYAWDETRHFFGKIRKIAMKEWKEGVEPRRKI